MNLLQGCAPYAQNKLKIQLLIKILIRNILFAQSVQKINYTTKIFLILRRMGNDVTMSDFDKLFQIYKNKLEEESSGLITSNKNEFFKMLVFYMSVEEFTADEQTKNKLIHHIH